jgi:hypothetical protein
MKFKESMRTASISGYEWSKEVLHLTTVLSESENMYFMKLRSIINSYDRNENVIVTILSKEYLNVGKIWLSTLVRLNIKQYIVIAADIETADYLDSIKIPNCRITNTETITVDANYRSRTGFTTKGLSVTVLKYPTVKSILELGYNVILMDIDSLLLKIPSSDFFENTDIAFQRVLDFPDPIAEDWGFAACSGFVWFRSTKNVIALIDNSINVQQTAYSDQIALNVSLWESGITWNINSKSFKSVKSRDRQNRINFLKDNYTLNIDGVGINPFIKVRALSPKLFWRDNIFPPDFSNLILFHPISPKVAEEKVKVFMEHKILIDSEELIIK